jgi:hypothetical protein
MSPERWGAECRQEREFWLYEHSSFVFLSVLIEHGAHFDNHVEP